MDVRSVHHVAFAVSDLDEAVGTYQRLFGAEVELRGRMEDQGVEAAYLRVGSGRVELMSALEEDTPVGRFLAKRGPGMHHVAYEVDDLEGELARLQSEGAELIDKSPREGLFGMQIAFVHPHSVAGVLTELVHVD